MKYSDAYLTPKEAAKLLQCTPKSIINYINRGKLSASKDDGKFYVEKAEFFRVFPQAFVREQERNPDHKTLEEERIKMENAMLKDLASKKDKEIDFLRSQLEAFNIEKSKMLDAITHHARLLEHHDKKKDNDSKGWFKIFKR